MKAKNTRAPMSHAQYEMGVAKAAKWMWYGLDEFRQSELRVIDWSSTAEDEAGNLLYPPSQALIACGSLARIHFRAPAARHDSEKRHPRRRRDTVVTFSTRVAAKSFLCFDPDHPGDRLYMALDPEVEGVLAKRFWTENQVEPRYLSEWAHLTGGRHSRLGGYPKLKAKPVGIMTAVVYFTRKKDDGKSFYIHRMGEVSCTYPILACDAEGRLWVCGGAYTSPTPGITD